MLLKKGSIVYKYLLSYIIILSIPLLILGSILYYNSVIMLKSEVEKIEISKVTNMKDTVDKQIKQLERIAINISFDKYMAPHIVMKNDYYTKRTSESLLKYKQNNMLIEEVFLYFRGEDKIISSGGKMSFTTLCQRFFESDKTAHDVFFKKMNDSQNPMIMITEESKEYNKTNQKYLLYIYPVVMSSDDPSAVVVFAIRESTLINHIRNSVGGLSGNVFAYGNANDSLINIVSLNADENFTFERVNNIINDAEESSVMYKDMEDKEYSVIKVTSDFNECRFYNITPKAILLKGLFDSKIYILRMLLLVITLGILISICLAVFNCSPIKKLNKKTKEELYPIERKAYKDEIEELESRILYTIEKNKNLTQQIKYHQVLFKDKILLMLLRGELVEFKNADELLASYQIHVNEGWTRVLVVSIGSFERRKATYSDISFWMNVILQDKISKGKYYFTEIIHDELAIIVNMPDNKPSKSFFKELANDLISVFAHQLNMKVSVGIGKAYEELANIKNSYYEALSALEHQIIDGNEKVTLFEDLNISKSNRYWYPTEEIMKLLQSLKQGNIAAFNEIINSIFLNISSHQLSIGLTKSICFGIINSIISLINELDTDEFANEIERLTQFKMLDDFKIKIDDIAFKICKHVNDSKMSYNEKLKEDIIRFLNEEYKNCNVSLEMVAKKFNVSPSYLSRYFKEQTGLKFVDYLKTLRINEAKKLLVSTEYNIKDIVNEIGYSDVANFTRTFRLLEGIPPGEYRKLYFQG